MATNLTAYRFNLTTAEIEDSLFYGEQSAPSGSVKIIVSPSEPKVAAPTEPITREEESRERLSPRTIP